MTTSASCSDHRPARAGEGAKPEHGRRERRSIWVSSGLNDYLNFPGRTFAIRRETQVKSGKRRCETAYGVTMTPEAASPEDMAQHHILDWSLGSQPAGTVRRT